MTFLGSGWYLCAGQDPSILEVTDDTCLCDLFLRRDGWADRPLGPRLRVTRSGNVIDAIFLIGEYPAEPYICDREVIQNNLWRSVSRLLVRMSGHKDYEEHVRRYTYGSATWIRANEDAIDVAEPLVHEVSALFERYGVVSDGPIKICRRR